VKKKSGNAERGTRLKAKDLSVASGKSPKGSLSMGIIEPCFKTPRGGVINPCFKGPRMGTR
jgi:hypothetical protein